MGGGNTVVRMKEDGLFYQDVNTRGYSYSVGAQQVTDVAPAELLTQTVTLLDGVTATGASSAVNALNFSHHSFQVEVTNGGSVSFEGSLDGTNYRSIATGASTDSITTNEGKYKFIRCDATWVSGALSVTYLGGN